MNTPPYIDAPHEKRRIPRQHLLVPIYCKLSRKEESGFGWVRDFSSTGAQLASSLSLNHGDELTLSLSMTGHDELTLSLPTTGHPEMEITGAVRWTQEPLLGIEFKPRPRDSLSHIADLVLLVLLVLFLAGFLALIACEAVPQWCVIPV